MLANFVLMPLGAVALAALLRLDEPLGVGLLLLGTAAGAPFLPKLAQIAKGNLAFAVGLMVLLMVVTVGYLPLVLPLLLPGVSVNPAEDCPFTVSAHAASSGGRAGCKALFRGSRRAHQTSARSALQPEPHSAGAADHLANVNNVLAVFGTRGILAGLLFIAIGFVRRLVARRTRISTRRVLALGTAQRNIAAALVVGSQSFSDPKVVVMVVVVAIVSLLILMPLSRKLAKHD